MSPTNIFSGLADECAESLDGQIAVHKSLGWNYIELRSVDQTPLDSLNKSQLREVAKKLNSNGLEVNMLASRIGNWSKYVTSAEDSEDGELENLLYFCKLSRCKSIRVMTYLSNGEDQIQWKQLALKKINRFRKLVARDAELYELDEPATLMIENCSGWSGQSPHHMREFMEELERESYLPAVGVVYDIGNGLTYNYNSLKMLEAVKPWVKHVHIKDGIKSTKAVHYTMPGEGECNLHECIRRLVRFGYTGLYAIEPHLDLIPHISSSTYELSSTKDVRHNYIEYAQKAQMHVASVLKEIN